MRTARRIVRVVHFFFPSLPVSASILHVWNLYGEVRAFPGRTCVSRPRHETRKKKRERERRKGGVGRSRATPAAGVLPSHVPVAGLLRLPPPRLRPRVARPSAAAKEERSTTWTRVLVLWSKQVFATRRFTQAGSFFSDGGGGTRRRSGGNGPPGGAGKGRGGRNAREGASVRGGSVEIRDPGFRLTMRDRFGSRVDPGVP
eukprot:scaffold360_cov374-Pavlova_lutheri.AAC.84